MDGFGFGFHGLGEPMSLADFRSVYNGMIMGNCWYSKADGLNRVQTGAADLVAFGRSYIFKPDLVERFKNDWPLNPCEDITRWYTDDAEGYADYQPYQPGDCQLSSISCCFAIWSPLCMGRRK